MAKPMTPLQKKRHLDTQRRKLTAIQEQVSKAKIGEKDHWMNWHLNGITEEIKYAIDELDSATSRLNTIMKEADKDA